MPPPPLQLPSRAKLARFGAPAAFLVGFTVAVLLVRAGFSASDEPVTTTLATTSVESTRPADTATTRPTTTATTETAGEPRFYTIERGDTYGSVAAEFDTTVERLIELNPGIDPTGLTIGQRIRVE